MKSGFLYLALIITSFCQAQNIKIDTLLTDKISIRTIQIWDGKVWYAGTDSKFGYIDLKNKSNQKQIKLAEKNLQFRTLAQNNKNFYAINIESPAFFFEIDKKLLASRVVFTDYDKTAFYDAFTFVDNQYGIAFSDPSESQKLNITLTRDAGQRWIHCNDCKDFPVLDKGEAAFAASNTNIASRGKYVWLATGGATSRIYRMKNKSCIWQVFETPIIQGTSSQGIYSIDFANEKFGIAVGGDYTKQSENINNIATTNDGGETWEIQASGHNAGYMTCVRVKPKSKGKEMIAVGDQHISYSSDFGKTWTKISDEKGFYTADWIDENSVILAGKDKIARLTFLK
ncbi:WD40/YVTN/BNR-like repeat-containing protein [Chryseobacterium sp. T1]